MDSANTKNHLDYMRKQGDRDFADDLRALNMAGLPDDGLNVLDIGCSDSHVSMDLLAHIDKEYTYTGVDQNEDVVHKAREKYPQNTYIWGDIFKPKAFKEITDNGPYNLVILSQVLMHVKDPLELLKTVRTVTADDGAVYIKVVEDGLKICHPGEKALQRVLSLYQKYKTQTPNYLNDARTDRFCGHKTYTYLVHSGFADIKHFIAFTDTVGKTLTDGWKNTKCSCLIG